MINWTRALWLTLLGILLAVGLLWAHISGPSDSVTGAPGEPTCADVACHTSFAVNSGPGAFMLTPAASTPGEYTPGDTIDIDIDLAQTGMLRWGFELTVLNGSNDPVGTILLSDPMRTQVATGGGGRQYLKHTELGTDSGVVNASPGWTFRWKAPAAGGGPVTFYAAGNAADGNNSTLGDYVYTLSSVLTEGPQSVHDPSDTRPESLELGANYPNPFNSGTRIPFRLDADAAGPVTLAILDVAGRRIRTLNLGRYTGAGDHWIDWDGCDEGGLPAPSGTYLVRLFTRAGADARKVTLLR